MSYEIEAQSDTQKAIISLGGERGYNSGDEWIQTDEVLRKLDDIHKTQDRPLSALVVEAWRNGRAGGSSYQTPEYQITVATSPREDHISNDTFREIAFSYATSLGKHFEQERMYVEYDGLTTILKKSDEESKQ